MPDKQNDNKLLAMLERRGYLRKRALEEDPEQPESDADLSPPEADLRYLFDTPESDAPKVTPAARQPVPGFSTPVIPMDQHPITERVESRMTERVVPLDTPVFDLDEPIPPAPAEREEPQSVEVRKPAPFSSSLDIEKEEVVMTREPASYLTETLSVKRTPPSTPAADTSPYDLPPQPQQQSEIPVFDRPQPQQQSEIPVFDRPQPQQQSEIPVFDRPQPQQPAGNYTERYLDIEELYEALALRTKRTDTIYLIEEYLKTLPDSLPDDSRREIVSKLIAASGFDYDLLTGDGVLRVKMLKDYAERFAQYTEDYVSARQAELEELNQQMTRVRRLIEIRRDLHKKQFFAIETEAQRLKEILTFITG